MMHALIMKIDYACIDYANCVLDNVCCVLTPGFDQNETNNDSNDGSEDEVNTGNQTHPSGGFTRKVCYSSY